MSAILSRSNLFILGAIALAFLLPTVIANRFIIDILTLILLTAILGQSWNILGGYAGQFSFGSVVFFGTGAYTSSILLMTYGIVGAFIGYLSFRYGLRGSYFALITLAFAEAFRVLANSVEFTGGGIGIFIPHKASLARMQFDDPAGYYYLALVLTGISIAVAMWLERSRFGAQLVAIRENQDAAEALGANAFRCKMYAIMIAGAMGSVGGTFYAQKYLYVDPPIAYGVATSVEMLLVTIVGGMGTIFGPLVGSFALHGVNEITRHFMDTPGLSLIVYGVILIGIIGYFPDGLIGLFRRRRRRKPKDA
jgi:branched-chain amino acid transport system permease protein